MQETDSFSSFHFHFVFAFFLFHRIAASSLLAFIIFQHFYIISEIFLNSEYAAIRHAASSVFSHRLLWPSFRINFSFESLISFRVLFLTISG